MESTILLLVGQLTAGILLTPLYFKISASEKSWALSWWLSELSGITKSPPGTGPQRKQRTQFKTGTVPSHIPHPICFAQNNARHLPGAFFLENKVIYKFCLSRAIRFRTAPTATRTAISVSCAWGLSSPFFLPAPGSPTTKEGGTAAHLQITCHGKRAQATPFPMPDSPSEAMPPIYFPAHSSPVWSQGECCP